MGFARCVITPVALGKQKQAARAKPREPPVIINNES